MMPCFLAILSISTDSSSDFEPSSTPYNKWQCISIKIHGPPFCFPELSLYYIQFFRAIAEILNFSSFLWGGRVHF